MDFELNPEQYEGKLVSVENDGGVIQGRCNKILNKTIMILEQPFRDGVPIEQSLFAVNVTNLESVSVFEPPSAVNIPRPVGSSTSSKRSGATISKKIKGAKKWVPKEAEKAEKPKPGDRIDISMLFAGLKPTGVSSGSSKMDDDEDASEEDEEVVEEEKTSSAHSDSDATAPKNITAAIESARAKETKHNVYGDFKHFTEKLEPNPSLLVHKGDPTVRLLRRTTSKAQHGNGYVGRTGDPAADCRNGYAARGRDRHLDEPIDVDQLSKDFDFSANVDLIRHRRSEVQAEDEDETDDEEDTTESEPPKAEPISDEDEDANNEVAQSFCELVYEAQAPAPELRPVATKLKGTSAQRKRTTSANASTRPLVKSHPTRNFRNDENIINDPQRVTSWVNKAATVSPSMNLSLNADLPQAVKTAPKISVISNMTIPTAALLKTACKTQKVLEPVNMAAASVSPTVPPAHTVPVVASILAAAASSQKNKAIVPEIPTTSPAKFNWKLRTLPTSLPKQEVGAAIPTAKASKQSVIGLQQSVATDAGTEGKLLLIPRSYVETETSGSLPTLSMSDKRTYLEASKLLFNESLYYCIVADRFLQFLLTTYCHNPDTDARVPATLPRHVVVIAGQHAPIVVVHRFCQHLVNRGVRLTVFDPPAVPGQLLEKCTIVRNVQDLPGNVRSLCLVDARIFHEDAALRRWILCTSRGTPLSSPTGSRRNVSRRSDKGNVSLFSLDFRVYDVTELHTLYLGYADESISSERPRSRHNSGSHRSTTHKSSGLFKAGIADLGTPFEWVKTAEAFRSHRAFCGSLISMVRPRRTSGAGFGEKL